MPYKEKKIEKFYYSIGEVAEMLGVNTSLIRFWEKNFDVIKPHKNKKGNRFFTKDDIENLKLIYHLVKDQRLTLEGARKRLSENKQEVTDNYQIVECLTNIREMLIEIRDQLDKD
ncbi:MAG: MerR family transcriptional regulator [Bacteroidales bacterium]|nr:MerR family transcriptional regulator [Bacteroidales bacterium]HPD95202.1 MerR family transcriptional regulator [Tenuifilaceae bacterium]HRX31478.1 MerR family transcriptional regulator [Tenuifilaceae bacterium]